MSTFSARLQRALDASGKSRVDLARVLRSSKGTLGVSSSAVGQALSGGSRSLTAENAAIAARFLGVDFYWLCTGMGSMTPAAGSMQLSAAETSGLYATDEQILSAFGRLLGRVNPALRQGFADMLAAWAASGGTEDRSEALLALLAASEKLRAAA